MTNHFLDILSQQKLFFNSGATRSIEFRMTQLKLIKKIIKDNEGRIVDSLKKDLRKPLTESILDEIILVSEEINFILKHLKDWMKPKKVVTPFPALWPGKSRIHYGPYGSILIIAPWNYPFYLIFSPLIGAIAAGNCIVLKPSEISMNTQALILELVSQYFPPNFIAAFNGGPKETQQLLDLPFNYIFYTGNSRVGSSVMEKAAKHLTPISLELGGKNPCIVDQTANIPYAARRIIWAKMTNAGQTCLAPDYIYVHHSQKIALIAACKNVLKSFFGENPEESNDYSRIINQIHFERVIKLMKNGNILFGGKSNLDKLYIAPTLLDELTWDDPIMQEEIFGPLLPFFTYEDISTVISLLNDKPKPLALYLFTHDNQTERRIVDSLLFGGGAINDCLIQVANPHLPFGGMGMSGMGSYHGKYSFETFSHKKSIYKKNWDFDFKIEYPPYSDRKLKWLRRIIKF